MIHPIHPASRLDRVPWLPGVVDSKDVWARCFWIKQNGRAARPTSTKLHTLHGTHTAYASRLCSQARTSSPSASVRRTSLKRILAGACPGPHGTLYNFGSSPSAATASQPWTSSTFCELICTPQPQRRRFCGLRYSCTLYSRGRCAGRQGH